MPPTGLDMRPVAGPQLAILILSVVVLEGQEEPAGHDVDPLVLDFVHLVGQSLPGLDYEYLPDIGVGLRPDQLMAPGLVDPAPHVPSAVVPCHRQSPPPRGSAQ